MSAAYQSDIVYGMDLGDRSSRVYSVDRRTGEVAEFSVKTRVPSMVKCYGGRERGLVVIEAGTHVFWVSRELRRLGYEVLVANPRRVLLISKSMRKNDRRDARLLCEMGADCPHLLNPIRLRSEAAQMDLTLIRSRANLVEIRTKLRNSLRGLIKPYGIRLPSTSSPARLAEEVAQRVGPELLPALEPLLNLLAETTRHVKQLDRRIENELAARYPVVETLRQIPSIGSITATTFALVIDDPARFDRSRTVGAYLGLVPRQDESGQTSKQLRITRAGDRYMRKLLVNCAQYLLGHHGEKHDCDLRRWGLERARRGGPRGKKQAVVAVARRLAVLMHRTWVTGEEFKPFRDDRVSDPRPA